MFDWISTSFVDRLFQNSTDGEIPSDITKVSLGRVGSVLLSSYGRTCRMVVNLWYKSW